MLSSKALDALNTINAIAFCRFSQEPEYGVRACYSPYVLFGGPAHMRLGLLTDSGAYQMRIPTMGAWTWADTQADEVSPRGYRTYDYRFTSLRIAKNCFTIHIGSLKYAECVNWNKVVLLLADALTRSPEHRDRFSWAVARSYHKNLQLHPYVVQREAPSMATSLPEIPIQYITDTDEVKAC